MDYTMNWLKEIYGSEMTANNALGAFKYACEVGRKFRNDVRKQIISQPDLWSMLFHTAWKKDAPHINISLVSSKHIKWNVWLRSCEYYQQNIRVLEDINGIYFVMQINAYDLLKYLSKHECEARKYNISYREIAYQYVQYLNNEIGKISKNKRFLNKEIGYSYFPFEHKEIAIILTRVISMYMYVKSKSQLKQQKHDTRKH